MFDKIVLRNSPDGSALSAGELAEALVYFSNVHLVLNRFSLTNLAKTTGVDSLFETLRLNSVTITYTEEMLGVHTDTVAGVPFYDLGAFSIIGHVNRGQLSLCERIAYALEDADISKRDAKIHAKKFLELATVKKLTSDHYITGGITKAAQNKILQTPFSGRALGVALANRLQQPELSRDFEFEIKKVQGGYFVQDNVDWDAVNNRIQQLDANADKLTLAHLLAQFQEAIADLHISAYYGSEYVASEMSSTIGRLLYADLLTRLGREISHKEAFQETTLEDRRAIAECINSGERDFRDVLDIVKSRSGRKFREFLKSTNTDITLLQAYFAEISNTGWIKSVPAKSARLAVPAAIGIVEPAIGIALSVADTFLSDRFFGGWRPQHFIEKKVKPFLSTNNRT
jgi:hypothetical protein